MSFLNSLNNDPLFHSTSIHLTEPNYHSGGKAQIKRQNQKESILHGHVGKAQLNQAFNHITRARDKTSYTTICIITTQILNLPSTPFFDNLIVTTMGEGDLNPGSPNKGGQAMPLSYKALDNGPLPST